MKRIVNPWSGMEGYGCYGCAPHNASGLRMEFYEQGDYIVSRWLPRAEYEGWVDTLHGGIQAALADEIASWVVFRKLQTAGVTSRLEMRYHRPILVSQGEIELRARIVSPQAQPCRRGCRDPRLRGTHGDRGGGRLFRLFREGRARAHAFLRLPYRGGRRSAASDIAYIINPDDDRR